MTRPDQSSGRPDVSVVGTTNEKRGSYLEKTGVYVFLISSACAFYLLNARLLLGHYDLGWHLAAGDLIRHRGSVPFADPWSFTSAGRQWVNLSWAWDVLASALFQYGGFGGLLFFVVACGGAIVGYLTSVCMGTGARAIAICISVLSAALLYPSFASYPDIYLAASPNVATMLFSVIFFGECLRRTRTVLALPAIMLLWVNLHGGFLIGLFIVGVFGAMALVRRDWVDLRTFSLVGLGCLAATMANPLGWHVYPATTTTLGHFVQEQITEWWPYYRNVTIPGSIPGILYIVAFVTFELRYKGTCPLEARLLSWFFLCLGLYQFRYMAFFFLFSTVPMSLHLDRLLPGRLKSLEFATSLFFAGTVTACAPPLAYLQVHNTLGLPPLLSQQDAQYLEMHFPHARLLNHWNYGGNLIFYTRGTLPIFVDGRAATAYPDPLLRDYFKLSQPEVNESAWDSVLAKYKIDTVLWVRAHDALRQFLVQKRGWKEEYTGQYASIYVRPPLGR